MLKTCTTFFFCLFASVAAAQPPPPGPPVPSATLAPCNAAQSNAPCKAELGVFLITNTVRNLAQAKVDATNARLSAEGRSSRASIESLQQWRPSRFATQMPNQPNSWFVKVPYILTIKVSIPVTSDRHIGIPIDVNVFCNNWQTDSSQVIIRSQPGPASFEGGNILEDVFNVGNYIDAQVRSSFSSPLPVTAPVPNSKCSAIDGADSGTQATSDDLIFWTVPRRNLLSEAIARPTIEVTFDSLTRLTARGSHNSVLYADAESIHLNVYANHDGRQKALTMREGDVAALNLPAVRLDARKYDLLAVIGNVDQPPNNPRDSAFAVSAKTAGFGAGSHTMQIPKWYSRPPSQFNPKPIWVRIPAYELHYTVRYLNSGELAVDGGTSTVRPPKVAVPIKTLDVIKLKKP
ncbi:hypothetical protein ABID19_003838 [Mesorhizobium robiniae]|uniref:DUF4384 domain-containing protein n=1 Tax=Mesorhizobium robiniae TaxID=559315 RepID=A0ABV2GR86_9HYPH